MLLCGYPLYNNTVDDTSTLPNPRVHTSKENEAVGNAWS